MEIIKLLRNIAVEQTYKDMDKFKIVLVYTDGLTETMIGVGVLIGAMMTAVILKAKL